MTLAFHLGRIPVRIEPWFWLMAVMVNGGSMSNPAALLVWIAVVFASVLAHELGHALMGMAFGLDPSIDLHGFGGTTSWRHKQISRGKKILISIAGPAIGIVIGGALTFATAAGAFDQAPRLAQTTIGYIVFANLYWGALNLLPILPLDGGNVMANIVSERPARILSIVLATALGLYAIIVLRDLWPTAFAAMFVMLNVRALAASRGGSPPPGRPPPRPPGARPPTW